MTTEHADGKRLWHYTSIRALRSVVGTNVILPSRAIGGSELRMPPMVWLSSNAVCELACRAAAELGIDGPDDLARAAWFEDKQRLARIRITQTGCLPWLDHPSIRALPDTEKLRLYELGIEAGAFYPQKSWMCNGCVFASECRKW